MYEELYREIPDVGAYLERLGLEAPEQCDEAYLDRLVYTHQCEIPFENIDVRQESSDFHRYGRYLR